MTQSLRIIHIVTRLNVGGISKAVIDSAAGLSALGHDCLIVSGVLPDDECDMSYYAREQKVAVIYAKNLRRGISLRDFCAILELYRIFVRFEPDIIHTHASKAGTIGRIAGMMYQIF